MRRALRTCGLVLGLAPSFALAESSQPESQGAGPQTPSALYLAYRAAFDSARTLDDVVLYLARETREMVARLSPEDRIRMFDTLKIMALLRDVTIVGEGEQEDGYVLVVEARPPEGGWMDGTIVMTNENGWKVVRENWRLR